MVSIYRTPEGRAEVLAWYDRALAQLPLPVDSRLVDTRFGETHLLVAGPPGARPLVVVHGGNGSALEMAFALGGLAETHRCLFVDVPGEPNRSSEAKPDKGGDDYARWMEDVLDAEGLGDVAMLGMSQGGYVVLKCCAAFPRRLTRVVLLVPEGFARPRPLQFLPRVLWPISRYRRNPTEVNARRIVAALSGVPAEAVDPAGLERMALVMRHVRTAATLGRPFDAASLAGLKAPVLLVTGGRDLVFPGERSAHRAREILPTLNDTIHLQHAGHVHPDVVGPDVVARITRFLGDASPT